MTVDPTMKKAALFSGLLHLFALLFLILGVIFSSLFAKEEEPYIFEMVALPESVQAIEPETFEPIPELTVDIPEIEPIEIPEPEPEPIVETPPPPKPKPVVQPPPPKPEPVKEEPKPKIISFDEFVKEHGKPEPPKEMPKPRPRQARKIDTSKIEKNLRKTIMSVPELSLSTTSTVEDTDAMRQWRSFLAARLDALWKQSQTEGTAGKSVKVSFYISSGGSISSVKVVQSSGLPDLDSIGIDTVLRLGNFQPPPSGNGETITVLFKVE